MNKVFLITGGSEGLGYEISKKLSQSPGNVVVVLSNNKSCLNEAGKKIECECYFCDITDVSQIESTVKDIILKHKKIDCLINNAGVWVGGELDENSYQDIAKVLLVNSIGTIYMTRAVLPYMKRQKSGQIVNIGSYDGTISKPERSPYVASKWAVTGFTNALRKELQKYNIGVFGFYPGLMKTNLFKNASGNRDMTGAMNPERVAEVISGLISIEGIIFDQVVFRSLDSESF